MQMGAVSHGLTLIELLVSLALLSALMMAVAGWIHTTASVAAEYAAPVHREAVVESARQRVGEDLLIGDEADEKSPRVRTIDQVLGIDTRTPPRRDDRGGAIKHAYLHDPSSGTFYLKEGDSDDARRRRTLLDMVADVTFEIDHDRRELVVAIEQIDSEALEWRLPLP